MPTTQQAYQFKITLKHLKPAIWRRIQILTSSTFWDLHVAIQDAMGWLDCHLHQFQLKNANSDHRTNLVGTPFPDWDDLKVTPGWTKTLRSYFSQGHTQVLYEYDFGDGWEHAIVLEKVVSIDAAIALPQCTAGKRACPPEDCGGPYGYEDLLNVIKDPHHPEYEQSMEWLGGDFNPETFKPALITFRDSKQALETLEDMLDE